VARRATTASERNMVVDVEDGDGEGENRKQGGAQVSHSALASLFYASLP